MRKLDIWAFYWSAKYMQWMTSFQPGTPLKDLAAAFDSVARPTLSELRKLG